MRRSKVLEKMRNGNPAVSVKLNLRDPRGAEIAAMCGFDCIWLDLEHSPNSIDQVEDIVRAAKIYDCDVITRVEKGGYNDYIKPLEADSTGIMIPHLMSLAEAKEIVYYTKFHPIGRRPLDGGNADGAYTLLDGKEYMETANRERFVIAQIEDPEPLAELEEICALEGIDMIFFGPADFTQGIGKPLQFSDPEVIRVRELIAKTAKKYGKFAGTVGNKDNFYELAALGYDFINIESDVCALPKIYKEAIKKIKNG
ncbi:MAG: aldolase [Clostridia bacterium]|nr:aldolase [Clostridia bacterium]